MIKIANFNIGPAYPPFVVAEMSANHNGALQDALKIVDAAKKAGAHAIKLQTYTADTMTLNISEGEFLISDLSLWNGRTLYDLYEEAHTPWDWHKPIQERCSENGLVFFSTPFDDTAVDFLETLNVPCYKIASLEMVDLNLIRRVAKTGKPLIISTGGATLTEIDDAVATARDSGCKDLILLACTIAYPASPREFNLRKIPDLAKRYNVLVGLSDHTTSIGVPVASVALGACLIEKHFTLSRKTGVDAAFSMEPHEMRLLAEESYHAWESLGTAFYGPTATETSTLRYRRSLYFVKDLKKGSKIPKEAVRAIRPGKGLPPKELTRVIDKPLRRDVRRGEPVSWDVIE